MPFRFVLHVRVPPKVHQESASTAPRSLPRIDLLPNRLSGNNSTLTTTTASLSDLQTNAISTPENSHVGSKSPIYAALATLDQHEKESRQLQEVLVETHVAVRPGSKHNTPSGSKRIAPERGHWLRTHASSEMIPEYSRGLAEFMGVMEVQLPTTAPRLDELAWFVSSDAAPSLTDQLAETQPNLAEIVFDLRQVKAILLAAFN